MSFEKIGECANAAVVDADAYHHSAFVRDRIYLFSKKYVKQPSYNWGHRVSFAGGYSIFFNITDKKWSAKIDFPAISEEENMAESFFALNSKIFILLYRQFGGIEFHKLLFWNETRWQPVDSFQVASECNVKASKDTRSTLIDVRQESGISDSKLFLSVVDQTITILQLSFDDHSGSLSVLHTVPDAANPRQVIPIMAARWKENVFIIGGIHGCGFRIEPNSWIVSNENTKESKALQINGDKPPFSYSGSRHTDVLPSGLWVHSTGFTAHGMTGAVFSGEIWFLDLKQGNPSWTKSATVVPSVNRDETVIVLSDEGVIYVVNSEEGLLAGKI